MCTHSLSLTNTRNRISASCALTSRENIFHFSLSLFLSFTLSLTHTRTHAQAQAHAHTHKHTHTRTSTSAQQKHSARRTFTLRNVFTTFSEKEERKKTQKDGSRNKRNKIENYSVFLFCLSFLLPFFPDSLLLFYLFLRLFTQRILYFTHAWCRTFLLMLEFILPWRLA